MVGKVATTAAHPTGYVYSAEPQPRKKFRDPPMGPINILHDPRVVRGNTHSLHRVGANREVPLGPAPPAPAPPGTKAKRRPLPTKPESAFRIFDVQVDDPLRQEVDLMPYLIENKAPIVHKVEVTQTDPFKERPPTPGTFT
jgi:hypothetical protein